MRVGEFLLKNNYVTQEILDEALVLQSSDKNLLLGEILVNMGALTQEILQQYLIEYMHLSSDEVLENTKDWLSQDAVDDLVAKYLNAEKQN